MIDTQDETLTPTDQPALGMVRPPARVGRRLALVVAILAMLVPATVAIASQLPASLVAEKEVVDPTDPSSTIVVAAPYSRVPSSALRVDDRVSFEGLEGLAEVDEDRQGDIFFVTISTPRQSVLSSWVGQDESSIQPLSQDEAYPPTQTRTQQREISLQMMRTSSQVAQFVALQALGFEDAELVPGAVVIGSMVCLEQDETGCVRPVPADEVLDVGDTILRADGEAVGTVDDLGAALDAHEPGDVVELEIRRAGRSAPETVPVELIAAPDGSGRTIVGFIPFDTASVQLPFEINIETSRIGGPSAGLAFTLTLIDELSDGDLTGGSNVAVTGEIGLDGQVGPIGGLPQKVAAVMSVDVEYFLVPASQSEAVLAAAREVAGDDVEIIPVATLDEALAALERLGGDPVPRGDR